MVVAPLCQPIAGPISDVSPAFWRLRATSKPTGISISFPKHSTSSKGSLNVRTTQNSKWAIRLSLVEQSPPKSTVDMKQLVRFLYEDLPHLFDGQRIDRTAYDERVKFRDPITKHDTISGYLFNIALLRKLFNPDSQLHWVKQLRIYKTPDLESPKYQILKRATDYEVRKYSPFNAVETEGGKLSGSGGFNAVTGYIFGKNSAMEKIPMTTPVFTEAIGPEMSKVAIQIALPGEKELTSLPDPDLESVSLREVGGGIAAVLKFSGKPTENIVLEKEKALRASVLRDGLRPKEGCLLSRYNDPGRTWSFIMRNEVLIWLEEYSID
ncbi:hypothetical protein Ancab_006934 [Ancistrocladus abbreviatus]